MIWMFQVGDDKPYVKKGQGKSASGDGVCEASKNAGKDPVRNAHKKVSVAWDELSMIMFLCFEF